MTSLYHNAIFVTSAEKMPKGEHWAIIEFGSIYVPGDERSRTNPGHGYPGGDESDYQSWCVGCGMVLRDPPNA